MGKRAALEIGGLGLQAVGHVGGDVEGVGFFVQVFGVYHYGVAYAVMERFRKAR